MSNITNNVVFRKLKKHGKRIILIPILCFLLVIPLFWGAIKGIFESASEIFSDVVDNVVIVGNNLEIDEEYLSEAKKKLERMGIDADDLGLGGHEEYLERFLEAEIVTNFPYLGGDGLQGTVYFERAKIDGSTTELKYISYDEFYGMINSENSDIYSYFTVDTEDWTVHVAKNSSQGSFEVEKINYKNMVEKFSMPFEFTIALAMVSQNPQFALAVVNLVKDSRIVIAIAESVTTTTTNVTYTYTEEKTTTDLETETTETTSENKSVDYEPEVEKSYYTSVFLARANTWILNEITDYTYEDTGDVEGDPQIEELEDLEYTTINDDYRIETRETNRVNTTIVTTRMQRWNQGQPRVIEKTSNFTNLILRDTNNISGQGLIGVAKECHDYLSDNGYTYQYGGGHSDFPNIESISVIDCSGYVSWVLYKAGYEDIGAQSSETLKDYANQKGWEVISSTNDLKPGDIVIYDGHTNILVSVQGNQYLFYDCGSTSAIQAKDPIEYDVNSGFQCGLRPNDDIIKALEPDTIEDLKDSIEEYLDGVTEGEYKVSVRDLDRNSDYSFIIGSSTVKSEGWIKLFIMATAFNEIKNGNLEEDIVSSDIERMITTDNNDAANIVLSNLGDGNISDGIEKVNSYLSRYNYDDTNIEEELSDVGSDNNYTSLSDVSRLLRNIYTNECVNVVYSQKMFDLLRQQLLIEYIPAGVTDGTTANKTGEQAEILQDAAIVSIRNANYLVVVSAENVENKVEAASRIADISRIVNAYFVEHGVLINNSTNIDDNDEIDTIMNGRRVCYKVPNWGYQCPLDNLVSGHEMLFDLLGKNEKTQNHENLMRYLLYLLTGDSYGVTEFNFEEFLNGSFSGVGGAWSIVWNNGCTREEFINAVNSYNPPNVTAFGRSVVDCYNRFFKDNAENYYDICTSVGIDPRIVFCIGIHESYYGTSNIANSKGNCWGWGAFDSSPYDSAWDFSDLSDGIRQVSSGLRSWTQPGSWQYEKMVSQGLDPTSLDSLPAVPYATDPNWPNAIKKYMGLIFNCTGTGGSGDATEMQTKIVQIASSQDTLGNIGGYCQAWVADVYAKAGQSRISSCCATTAAQKWIVSTDQSNIPLGACVYGVSSSGTVDSACGQDAGHVGIYIGNGQVASNVGGIKIESLSSWINSFSWKGWGWNGGVDYSK